ncbi:MAG TPA: helix-turn-helix transcriptional regulator [Clostridia bacterium]|nr:helix-turn-helix transcriptional regulator [Clostridia bacterium]
MKSDFSYFVKSIPQDMYSRTKSYICQHIAIFEPEEFVLGEEICVDDYHFVLFFSESPVTRINNCEYQGRKGSFIAVQPWQEVYGVPCDNRKQGRYMHIAIKKDFFRKITAEIAGEEGYVFKRVQNVYSRQLLDIIGNFQKEMMNYGESFPSMIESICTQIVFQLIRDLNADIAGNKSKISKDNKYINKAIQFMQEYYSANICINDICNLIYLSPCHFKRVFKDYTGQTPYQYLTGIRMEKAKELLSKNENSMEEVARLCGFVNSGHFATVFKRNINMSPTEFKKMEA